ncbi:recombinase family protein [Arthrobacter sp. 2MCAF14]|uniref:recombinase family protein n=1 Tax=Arthrobacter sp. 2MCAF14 TaxID=3232982 RepID=UPI003F8FEE21
MRQLGYTRIITAGQDAQLQLDALLAAGVQNRDVFADVTFGSRTAIDRPGMKKLLEYAEAGDTAVVWRVDRLGRSLIDVLNTSVTEALRSPEIVSHCFPRGLGTGQIPGILSTDTPRTALSNGTRSQGPVIRRCRGWRITGTAAKPMHPTFGFPVAMDCRDLADVCSTRLRVLPWWLRRGASVR